MPQSTRTKTTDQPAAAPAATPEVAATGAEAVQRAPRPGSKFALLVDLLEREAGATIAEIMTATGWQQHTVRGALAGVITRKLGRVVSSEKVEGRGRVYRSAARHA